MNLSEVQDRSRSVFAELLRQSGQGPEPAAARPQPLDEITEANWDEIIDGNLKSCFLVTQAVLADMRSGGFGRIINLSSVAAQIGTAGRLMFDHFDRFSADFDEFLPDLRVRCQEFLAERG